MLSRWLEKIVVRIRFFEHKHKIKKGMDDSGCWSDSTILKWIEKLTKCWHKFILMKYANMLLFSLSYTPKKVLWSRIDIFSRNLCGGTGITAQYGTFFEAGNASNGISSMIQIKSKKANTYKYKKSNCKIGIEKEIS